MAVKLELYRVFQEVARMGNISAAAQNLYISQSAVSQSIKQLEEQLQVRLFSRSTRGVVLTSEGKMLLDYVSHGLGLIQCGEEKLAQSRQLLTGELIIGASDTVTKTYLVSRLEAFHQNYPAIQIRILNGTSQMVLDYLLAGRSTSPLPASRRTRTPIPSATASIPTRSSSPRRITTVILTTPTRLRRSRPSRSSCSSARRAPAPMLSSISSSTAAA